MPALLKTVALLLLALWLPATLHCGLEAAGVGFGFDCHDAPAAADGDTHGCRADACDTVEGGSYAKSLVNLRVLPPVVVEDLGVLLLAVVRPLGAAGPAVGPDDPPVVRVLQRSWSFVRRTALPARAPDRAV